MPRRQSAKSDPDPRWTSKLPPAPGDLRIVQAFVNTSLGGGDGPAALGGWLAHWSLAPLDTKIDDDDFERAIDVREALWEVIAGNRDAAKAAACLDAAAAPLRVRFAAGGRPCLEAACGALDGALARLCGIVAVAQIDGSWPRMKVCANETCRAAFFDFSKNRSAKFCRTQCGNRISALSYRHRNLERIRRRDRIGAFGRRNERASTRRS